VQSARGWCADSRLRGLAVALCVSVAPGTAVACIIACIGDVAVRGIK
jgi:hypothetical protein